MTPQEKKEILYSIAEKLYTNYEAKGEILYLLIERIVKGEKPVEKEFVERLLKRFFVKQPESKVPVMERFITRYYEDKDGKIKEERKKIKEIVSQDEKDGDFWEADGKQILSLNGILKCAAFADVKFGNLEAVDKPNSNNAKGFYLTVEASSLNRHTTYGTGSANDDNAKSDIANKFKFETAHSRAITRTFLTHVGLFDVYSGVEADDWSKEEHLKRQLNQQNRMLNQTREQAKREIDKVKATAKDEISRRNRMIDELAKYVALPPDDEKYPSTYILTIIEKGDYEYAQELTKHSNTNIGWVAKRLLSLNRATIEEQEALEQVPMKGSDEPVDLSGEENTEPSMEKTDVPEEEAVNMDGTQEENESTKDEYQQQQELENSHEPIVNEEQENTDENSTFIGHHDVEITKKHLQEEQGEDVKPTNKKKEHSKPFTFEPIEGEEYINVDFRLDKNENE